MATEGGDPTDTIGMAIMGINAQAIIALGAITIALGIINGVTTVPMPQRFSEVLQLAP
ncbi:MULTISPECIES: hypothetical protein [unclassified Rhizobium]|uniref:hypothetical protein n=1 Tax=unclassified Rhizobium TaxID=2613769 RepID=UPI002180CFB2|nr:MULTISPECIES: hypothetical protein [unclassified Rhizobium]